MGMGDNMSISTTRLLTAVAAVAILLPATANASARRAGMNGELLIQDRDDIFLFPQLTLDHVRTFALSYQGGGGGDGVAIIGQGGTAIGVAINRPETANLGLMGYAEPHTVLDILFGFKVGKNKAGARLGIINGANNAEPKDGDPANDGQFGLKLGGGFSMKGASLSADVGADITFLSGTQEAGGEETGKASAFSIALGGRAYAHQSKKVDLGIIGGLVFASTAADKPEPKQEGSLFGLYAGAGPVYRIGKNTAATVNGVVGFRSASTKSDGEDGPSSSQILFPGVQATMERQLFDWLVARSGMSYTFTLDGTDDGSDNKTASRGGEFGWSAGAGVLIGEKDDFVIDLNLSQAWITGGPFLLSGQAGALSGEVTAALKF